MDLGDIGLGAKTIEVQGTCIPFFSSQGFQKMKLSLNPLSRNAQLSF